MDEKILKELAELKSRVAKLEAETAVLREAVEARGGPVRAADDPPPQIPPSNTGN